MSPTLFTLGFEGLTIEAFIARLQAAQVKTVVDVHELPLSRKKGGSKSAFCGVLSAHGIAYLHAPDLGCLKPIRYQYKADGNRQTCTTENYKDSEKGSNGSILSSMLNMRMLQTVTENGHIHFVYPSNALRTLRILPSLMTCEFAKCGQTTIANSSWIYTLFAELAEFAFTNS